MEFSVTELTMYLGIGLLPVLLLYFILFGKRGKIREVQEKYILITGCDSGFGRLLAQHLDKVGVHVFATCLFQKSVDELKELSRCDPFVMDVTNSDQIKKAVALVKQKLPSNCKLWGIVNNAGILGNGFVDWVTLSDYKKVLKVNLFGVIDVTTNFLPLIKKAKGRVVIVSSILGRHHEVFAAPYVTSKFGIIGFADSLRLEMRPFDVSVHNVCPGYFQTDIIDGEKMAKEMHAMHDKLNDELRAVYDENYAKELSEALRIMPTLANPAKHLVVEAMEDALFSRRPKPYYYVGMDAWIMNLLTYFPIHFGDWLYCKIFPFPLPNINK